MSYNTFDLDTLRDKNYYSLLYSLVDYIRNQHYNAGEKLPQESILAEELNTNRSTLREMLRVLEVVGVIESRRGSGNVYLGNMEVGFMNIFMISSVLQENKPYEFSSIRGAIEAAAIEAFIDNATETDMYRLEIIYYDKMSKTEDKSIADYLDAHIEFHNTLMKYYANESAKQLVRANLRLIRRNYEEEIDKDASLTPDAAEKVKEKMYNSSHEKILLAVKARDRILARRLIIDHAFMSGLHSTYELTK